MGKVVTSRGMYLKEDIIEDLKNEIDKTIVLKSLLRKFTE
jgi:hypothetical protein